jgi:hypothetical protein
MPWMNLLRDGLVMMVLPVAAGSLCALPLWLKRRMILGNAIGSAVIAVIMIVVILQRFSAFFATDVSTVRVDSALMSMLLPAVLGWLDVLFLFFIGGAVEDRVKRKIINPDDF